MTTTDPSRTGVRPAEHFVARLEDLPLNAVHQVELEGRLIGVIRTDESVHAIGNACPHQGGPMCFGQVTGTMVASTPDEYVYDRHGLVIRCPWHAYEFDLETGASVGGVLSGRIAVFETVVRDGDVYCVLRRVGLKGR
jgi:nitrite reductase/ring-hydroxylating ferredoxin subunit